MWPSGRVCIPCKTHKGLRGNMVGTKPLRVLNRRARPHGGPTIVYTQCCRPAVQARRPHLISSQSPTSSLVVWVPAVPYMDTSRPRGRGPTLSSKGHPPPTSQSPSPPPVYPGNRPRSRASFSDDNGEHSDHSDDSLPDQDYSGPGRPAVEKPPYLPHQIARHHQRAHAVRADDTPYDPTSEHRSTAPPPRDHRPPSPPHRYQPSSYHTYAPQVSLLFNL